MITNLLFDLTRILIKKIIITQKLKNYGDIVLPLPPLLKDNFCQHAI